MSPPLTTTAPPPVIPRELLVELYAHARATYPEECCGFLIGPRGGGPLDQVQKVENRQNQLYEADPEQFARDSRTAYNMGAKDILWLNRSLTGERPVQVIYHSHCDVGAYFSAEDQRAATWEGGPLYPMVDYLVIDAHADRIGGAKLFRFDEAARQFVLVAEYAGE